MKKSYAEIEDSRFEAKCGYAFGALFPGLFANAVASHNETGSGGYIAFTGALTLAWYGWHGLSHLKAINDLKRLNSEKSNTNRHSLR